MGFSPTESHNQSFKLKEPHYMRILDGKAVAAKIRGELAEEISTALIKGHRPPGLAVILIGEDPASQVYVRNKQKACNDIGINSFPYILPKNINQQDLLNLIEELNSREDIDGILLQLPIPENLDSQKCLMAIDPKKDVDAFHPLNIGKLALGLPGPAPCTPAGILELLSRENISLKGKKAVVIGRSDIVGKPLSLLLARKGIDATVTICHSATPDLEKECKDADFLFVAMGKPKAIKAVHVPDHCTVIDVGIHRTDKGLCGDVDYNEVCDKVEAITPVPGGVGPMTIAMLMKNTVQAWKDALKIAT